MTKPSPAMTPPSVSTSTAVAAAVPPVASTSSMIRIRSPGWIASRWISSLSVPYSSWYSSRTTAHGSLPALRTGTKPAPDPIGDRRGEDEAPGFDADHPIDRNAVELFDQAVDRRGEGGAVAEQRRDVAERDAVDRVVADVSDEASQRAVLACHVPRIPVGRRDRQWRFFLRGRGGCDSNLFRRSARARSDGVAGARLTDGLDRFGSRASRPLRPWRTRGSRRGRSRSSR